ncbi:multicopper oxidase domain-containing protein [Methylococcus geothermalis]|uniref:Multicopper oxidase domain-containing protein n=1 Tax=Methylococcus geothermalis TaxID=2681310 RepID=A0A858QAL0_9GAMM|nr:multicopper oxidase domain-containing protein [Methylococcus geothermalis]
MTITTNSRSLSLAALTIGAAVYASSSAAMMGGGCMMGCTSTTVIDPPRGAAFADPATLPNLSTTPGVVEVNLEAKIAPVDINGTTANLQTYNGLFPGPTIKVKKGDILKVHFKNSLPYTGVNDMGMPRDMTNLHTHGLHVSPAGNADNVLVHFLSGETFDYEYDLSLHRGGNLNFYHPHVHGNVAEQVWAGQAGALEVADESAVLSGYETHTLVLKDITLSGGAPAAHTSSDFMNGKEGDTMMVNGQVNPVLAMRPGQVQRWKIVNASNARFYKLSLASHSLRVVGTDGGLLDKPYAQSTVLLSPGERVDVLVKASSTKGYYKLQALPYNRGAGDSANQQITLMTVNVTGSSLSQSLPATVDPSATRLSVPANALTRQITLSMGMGMMGGGSATINGIAFSDTEAYTITSGRETYEVWEIYNQSMMDHPFHQHVNPAQVISISGGDSAYNALYTTTPAWKDTVIVPAMGSVKLLVPVKDYGGTTVFHCHILEHEDMGMMGIWNIQ